MIPPINTAVTQALQAADATPHVQFVPDSQVPVGCSSVLPRIDSSTEVQPATEAAGAVYGTVQRMLDHVIGTQDNASTNLECSQCSECALLASGEVTDELPVKSLYSRVPACQITTYYYVGFAYLMMKRYQITKKTEQMYILLAICLTLCPQRIDENVLSQLRERCSDRIQRLQRGDLQTFEEGFSYACPKFISPVPPNFDAPPANFSREPFNLQVKVFLNEVSQQSLIPVIRRFFSYPIEEWRITTSRIIIQEFRYSALWVATVGVGVGTVLDGAEVATEKSTKRKGF
ncbi:Eukaryotic translation initiation factor 3 subunit L [Acropora cervicornis]|uniref:Eukaryotic translation initiation factor 3 subunit L n=1 Tax=Acropora cervicornis TaxID=6130 RepID=A0AAD9PVI8_ACRCE|nr:Eukaryotic translation initiation factor 3 subunit L [Acropora cervicornis]